MRFTARLKQWLAAEPRRPDKAVTYVVTCPAGHAVRGLRQQTHQVVHCSECGRSVFVLPRSVWPVTDRSTTVHGRFASPWRRPLIAAMLTVVVMVAALVVLFIMLRPPALTPKSAPDHKEAGELAL